VRFLVTTHQKDTYLTIPEETRVKLFEVFAGFIDRNRKAGKCKEIYYLSDMKGSTSIWELESSEERARLVLDNPMRDIEDMEIQPVVEWDVGVGTIKEALKKSARKESNFL